MATNGWSGLLPPLFQFASVLATSQHLTSSLLQSFIGLWLTLLGFWAWNPGNHQPIDSRATISLDSWPTTLQRSCQGLPWWSSGLDSVLPLQGARVWSLVGELRSPHAAQYSQQRKKNNTQIVSDTSYNILWRQALLLFLLYCWGTWGSHRLKSQVCVTSLSSPRPSICARLPRYDFV